MLTPGEIVRVHEGGARIVSVSRDVIHYQTSSGSEHNVRIVSLDSATGSPRPGRYAAIRKLDQDPFYVLFGDPLSTCFVFPDLAAAYNELLNPLHAAGHRTYDST